MLPASVIGAEQGSYEHRRTPYLEIFPLTHGREERVATCATCHPNGTTTYTCFGCHEHTPGNVLREHDGRSLASIANCIECHVGGREGGD